MPALAAFQRLRGGGAGNGSTVVDAGGGVLRADGADGFGGVRIATSDDLATTSVFSRAASEDGARRSRVLASDAGDRSDGRRRRRRRLGPWFRGTSGSLGSLH